MHQQVRGTKFRRAFLQTYACVPCIRRRKEAAAALGGGGAMGSSKVAAAQTASTVID